MVYFTSLFSHFAFHTILRQGWYSRKTSKDFIVYFFAALTKHKIWMKYEKCILSVLYFLVCFAKTVTKYTQNAKYDQSIAGVIKTNVSSFSFDIGTSMVFPRCSKSKFLSSDIKTWTRSTQTGGWVQVKACIPVSYLPKMVFLVMITHVLLVWRKVFMLHQHLFLQDHSFDVPIFSNKVSFLRKWWVMINIFWETWAFCGRRVYFT